MTIKHRWWHTRVLWSANDQNDALGIVHMLYRKLAALNCPMHLKIRTKPNPFKTAEQWMRHFEASWSLLKKLSAENMLKNKSVFNIHVCRVSVSIYDLLTTQVAYFKHHSRLLVGVIPHKWNICICIYVMVMKKVFYEHQYLPVAKHTWPSPKWPGPASTARPPGTHSLSPMAHPPCVPPSPLAHPSDGPP